MLRRLERGHGITELWRIAEELCTRDFAADITAILAGLIAQPIGHFGVLCSDDTSHWLDIANLASGDGFGLHIRNMVDALEAMVGNQGEVISLWQRFQHFAKQLVGVFQNRIRVGTKRALIMGF